MESIVTAVRIHVSLNVLIILNHNACRQQIPAADAPTAVEGDRPDRWGQWDPEAVPVPRELQVPEAARGLKGLQVPEAVLDHVVRWDRPDLPDARAEMVPWVQPVLLVLMGKTAIWAPLVPAAVESL